MCIPKKQWNMRVLALITAAVLVLCLIPGASAAEREGSCGANLSWSFADGTLTITGSGAMTDYSTLENIPWYSFRNEILRVSLPEGLTRVGNMAFYDCNRLTTVTIPSTVTSIGEMAFCQCTGITILQLNQGLQVIGRSAFEMCTSLQDLRIPETVTTLDRHAFYYCRSLRYVVVPASVTTMGSAVFAYCDSLVRAEINAPLAEIPHWTFYGCDSLTSISLTAETKEMGSYAVFGCDSLYVVYYGGEAGDASQLQDQITQDKADFGHFGFVVDEDSGNQESSQNIHTDSAGDVIVENITVTQTGDATVTVTTTANASNGGEELSGADITATVIGSNGWQDVMDAVESEADSGNVNVNIFLSGTSEIPQDVLDSLAGKNVNMTVIGTDGSSYELDFRMIQKEGDASVPLLDLSYLLYRQDSAAFPELGGADAFRLVFNSTSAVPAKVIIQLPVEICNKGATLFQVEENGSLTNLQSVLTDRRGQACFYLGSVDQGTEYYIGINVPGIVGTDLIIPENMQAEYGITEQFSNIEYVVTGRTSSWNMSMGQVGGILAGVMAACVIGIGAAMYILNKRKLKKGYIPVLDEEEN